VGRERKAGSGRRSQKGGSKGRKEGGGKPNENRFAKDMKNRKETQVVLKVVGKCLERIKAINAMRKDRKPLQLVRLPVDPVAGFLFLRERKKPSLDLQIVFFGTELLFF
jgi:hypothetical protein